LREGEQEETEILLEDPKLDPNAKCRSINNGKETEATLLHAAVKADNELAVRKLLEKGADVNAKAYISFEITATDPPECYYKKNQEIEIPLRLTSSEQTAQEETFHILSATLSNGTDVLAHITPTQLRLQNNIVRYRPQAPGEHNIRLLIGVPYEEKGVQKAMCRVAVPAAVWSVRAKATDTEKLTITIEGPEEWATESWRIVGNPQWSEGLTGTIFLADNSIWEDTPLRRGDNESQITLIEPTFNDPHLSFTVEGPDKVAQTYRVDLTQLCVEQLKGDMSEQERILATRLGEVNAYVQQVDEHFTQDAQRSYQLPPETATDPRVNNTIREELTTLLGEIENYQRIYKQNFQVFEAHLESLAQGQTNTNVHRFRHAHKRLKDAISSLKSAQVQLECRCTSAHEALFKKLHEGKQQDTEILLEDPKLDPNAKCRINNREETLLHAAARMDNEMAVKKLMEKGANVNVKRSTDEATPLYLAITRGHENVAIILLEAEDIDPNARCCINDEEQETSLHAAARMGNEVTVRKLLEKGADVNVERSTDEATPLYLAIDRDHASIVIVLLAVEGIDVNAKCRINEDDEEQETLLHAAARMGNEVAVRKLMEKGADVNEMSTDYLTLMPKYALAGDSLTTDDAHYASEAGSADLREIWNQEVEVEEGDTPLHLAIDRGHEGVVRILLEAKNINVNARSRDGATPLHAAAGKNNPEVVKLLLNAGAEVNNQYGKISSLSRAPNYEHLSSLLNEIHSSEYDISPLHIATANGNLEIITLLIDREGKINQPITYYRQPIRQYVYRSTVAPLHLAAAQGSVAAVQLLLDRGARINQLASCWTPLHVAVWMNQIDVAKVLIDRGAKINPRTHTKNNWEKTPYELAKTTEMRNLLQASGGRRLSLIEKVFPSLLAPG
jgi:ankyrin repeat protein